MSNFARTRQTAAPLAAALDLKVNLYQADYSQGVAETIVENHVGDRVLIVGHSNDIASALGGTGLSDLNERYFDQLFVIHRFGDVVHLDEFRYAAEMP